MTLSKIAFATAFHHGSRLLAAASIACLAGSLVVPTAHGQDLSSYAILAGSTITNRWVSHIEGNIGLSPGTDFPGRGPGIDEVVLTNGAIHIADAVAVQAKSDLTTAFNVLMNRPSTAITGDLGQGRTLTAGVYSFASSAQLTGTLTLNGGSDDIFIIQVGSSLTAASSSVVELTGGALASNVFFVVRESATLGTTSKFVGQIMAGTSITLNTEATILCGAALAQTGAVTLDTNTINICPFTAEPEDIADVLGDDITGNGGSIIDAINDYVENGGTLPLSFQLLALLSPTELAEALEQLSGELGTEVAPAGMQGMDSFLSLLRGGRGRGSLAVVTGQDEPVAGGTVSVMGYAPGAPQARSDAFAGFGTPARASDPGNWTAWVSGYGGRSRVDSDGADSSHDRTAIDFGLAFGLERQISADTMFGLAVSGGGTNFELEDSLGSGTSAMVQAALYARSDFDQVYLAGAVAFGYHRVSLDRVLSFAGAEFTADFDATNYAGEIEAGYHMGWFTPYVALRGQAFSTPAYSEVTTSGASTFALDYDANVATSLRTEIGARADWSTDFEAGSLTLYASAAWAHEIGSGNEMTASFQTLPGSSFTVSGTTPSADSLLAAAGAELQLDDGVAISGSLKGEYSRNAASYGATAGLSYSW